MKILAPGFTDTLWELATIPWMAFLVVMLLVAAILYLPTLGWSGKLLDRLLYE